MARKASRTGSDQHGFTIVELLIVIVVIAILAAITIVAFNGITNQAKASAASVAAEQASTKVAIYMTTNGDQVPADLASAGVTDQNGTSYQYRTDTSSAPQRYCITATSNGVSAFINNSDQTSPRAGACPGHGVDGGGTITNLALNPSFENNMNDIWEAGSGSAAVSRTLSTAWASRGASSIQLTKTSIDYAPKGVMVGIPIALNAGDVVRWSAVVRNGTSSTKSFSAYGERSSPYAGLGLGAAVAIPANAAQTITGSYTVSSGTAGPAGVFGFGVLPASTFTVGESYFVDAYVITVNQPLPAGAVDGSSPNWAWNGTPNNSTSTGPAL